MTYTTDSDVLLAPVYTARRANLKAQAMPDAKSLAARLGFSVSYLSQLIGETAVQRPITEKTARKIEAALKLVPGWLDMVR